MNILHISTHDSGRWFGCYGIDTVHTPAIDQLASEGLLLEQCFAVSPICSPSRGAAMTGLYPQRNGLVGLTHHGFSLKPDVRHLAEILGERGYQPVLFSFQHETVVENWRHLGFENYLCPENGETEYPLMFKSAPEVAESFAEFLDDRTEDRPFYAQVGFNETHTPFWFGGAEPDQEKGIRVPEYLQPDETAEQHLAALQGSLKQADEGVRILLSALDAHQLRENTLVIFTTDHGIECQRDKWTLYDPGVEIACIFSGPGVPSGSRIKQPLSNIDFLPTLLDLVNQPIPNGLDGRSRANLFRGSETVTEDLPIFGIYFNGACRSVRTARHKLIWNFGPEPYVSDPPVAADGSGAKHARPVWELYDLSSDPNELHNLAGTTEVAKIETGLKRSLKAWLLEVNDPSICL